jgi:hypothetical protein
MWEKQPPTAFAAAANAADSRSKGKLVIGACVPCVICKRSGSGASAPVMVASLIKLRKANVDHPLQGSTKLLMPWALADR